MSISQYCKRRLALSIIQHLLKEAEQSPPDKRESIEVAVQCIESAYGVDYNYEVRNNTEIENLLELIGRQTPQQNVANDAEGYKAKGNDLMRSALYQEAIDQYSRAIALNPSNAVYFCNRAAAFSRLENHAHAISDCEEAVRLDPKYAKAYGRLGIAYSCLNRYEEARDSYRKALIIDPGNAMYEENLRLAEDRLRAEALEGDEMGVEMGAEPENVDLNQFMTNPNLLNMASQMLNDPNVRNIMSGLLHMGGGEGTSANPNIDVLFQMGQQLAQQMQINNPRFVDNLRRQFSTEGAPGGSDGTGHTHPHTDRKDQPPGSNGNASNY